MSWKHLILSVFLACFAASCNSVPLETASEGNSLDLVNKIAQAKQTAIPEKKKVSPITHVQNIAKKNKPGKKKELGPYRINIGDVLEISVLDEPEMTRSVTVIPDGTITYLLVGTMKVNGKTIPELRSELTKKLSSFFVSPYVSVMATKINLPEAEKQQVSLLGALKNPGNYEWHEGDKLLDMIAEAGGLLYTQTELGSRTTANLKASYLSRGGKLMDVDFYNLLQLGDMTQNVPLQPDDFIFIATAEDSNVIVMGEVDTPRIIPYNRNISLIEALSICGGFTKDAYQSRVIILRPTSKDTKYVEVDVNELLHGKDISNLMLRGGDIVYVPEQTLSEYSRYAGFLSDIADVILSGYEVYDAVRFPRVNRRSSAYSH